MLSVMIGELRCSIYLHLLQKIEMQGNAMEGRVLISGLLFEKTRIGDWSLGLLKNG
jgi:hypothetical protein